MHARASLHFWPQPYPLQRLSGLAMWALSHRPGRFLTFRAGVTVVGSLRDQGVDVVAEKNGIRLVLQCKLYSRPVGNKAVQEAAAARAHEAADYGVVVSNNRYTQDAQQLASTNR